MIEFVSNSQTQATCSFYSSKNELSNFCDIPLVFEQAIRDCLEQSTYLEWWLVWSSLDDSSGYRVPESLESRNAMGCP
jgi:hypothetical protein